VDYAQQNHDDEADTPISIAVDMADFDEEVDGFVAMHEQDTEDRVLIPMSEITKVLSKLQAGSISFRELRDQYPHSGRHQVEPVGFA